LGLLHQRRLGPGARDGRLVQHDHARFVQPAQHVRGADGGGEIEEGRADDQDREVGQHDRARRLILTAGRGVDHQGVGFGPQGGDLQGVELGRRGFGVARSRTAPALQHDAGRALRIGVGQQGFPATQVGRDGQVNRHRGLA
jgi:hypothetical protein